MWHEKRSAEDIIFFSILPIVINIVTNFVYFINRDSYGFLNSVSDWNSFSLFSIVACSIFNFLTKVREISEEEKKELSKKMYGMKLLGIVFIGYIIFAVFIVKNRIIIFSSLIMCAGYINWYILKCKIRIIGGLSEVQRNWRKACNKTSYEEVNFLWRIKPMLVPHVSVSSTERIKHINWIGLMTLILLIINFRLDPIYMMGFTIFIIFLISDVLYLLDFIFGLYTETEGICTGVLMKQKLKGPRRIYYEVYVTDFSNKREIKFTVFDYCNYNEQDVIKIIHGGLSKIVINVNKQF